MDEIAELDLSLQVKLLRVIQQKEFERVGGHKTIKVDVRIIAATNKNLENAVSEGKFREDLFYRLNVIPIHMPPLRERIEDIPLLLEHFIHHFCKKRKRRPFKFSSEAMQCLIRNNWKGNVRELENLVERLSILTNSDIITPADLPEKFIGEQSTQLAKNPQILFSRNSMPSNGLPETGFNMNEIIADIEKNLINEALLKSNGVKSKAALLLGLKRTTLIEKMKKMGMDKKPK